MNSTLNPLSIMTPRPSATRSRLHPNSNAGDAVFQAVLLSPHVAEGTVVFYSHAGRAEGRGDFFPGGEPMEIYEKTRCQMMLAESRVVLNVTVFPVPAGSYEECFPFEIAAWEPLEPPTRHLTVDWAVGFGAR